MAASESRRDAVGAAGRTPTSAQEAAPLRRRRAPGAAVAVGVVVAVGVPALGGHLGDGVDAGDDVRPRTRRCRRRRGKIAAMPDDGDVERGWRAGSASTAVRAARPPPRRRRRCPALTSWCSSAMVVTSVAQGGDLADHEHALAVPGSASSTVDQLVAAVAAQALAGDAQPTEVELLELGPHRPCCRLPAASQPALRSGERRARSRSRRSGWRDRARSRAARCCSQPSGHGLERRR